MVPCLPLTPARGDSAERAVPWFSLGCAAFHGQNGKAQAWPFWSLAPSSQTTCWVPALSALSQGSCACSQVLCSLFPSPSARGKMALTADSVLTMGAPGLRGAEASDGTWVCGVCVGGQEALLSVGWPWGWAGTRGPLSLSVHVLLCHQESEFSVPNLAPLSFKAGD